MRVLFSSAALLLLALAANAKPTTLATGAEVNEFVDRLVEQVKIYIIDHGMEPFAVPDQVSGFSYEDFLGIVWHGEASLRNGHIQGLTTLHRENDVDLSYEGQVLIVDGQLAFDVLQYDTDFEATIMDLGPDGQALILADGVTLGFRMHMDLANLNITMETFDIVHTGHIDLTVHGLGIALDFLTEVLGNLIVNLFKGPILGAVEDAIFELIQKALENLPFLLASTAFF